MANSRNISLIFVRGYRNYIKAWLPDAVKYEKVKYHPRTKDHVDPPIIPSKVLMVHRVKPFKGNPHWEKTTLKHLGFQEEENDPIFVKNTPEICAMLWRVKHLIKIVPVKLPDNVSNVNDLTEFYVDDNGTVYEAGKIDSARYEATVQFQNSMKKMTNGIIKEKLKLMWLKGNLF